MSLYFDEDPGVQNAQDMVNKRFDQVDDWLRKHDRSFSNAIQRLRDVFKGAGFPREISSVGYDYITPGKLSLDLPNAPNAPDFKPNIPSQFPQKIGDPVLTPIGHIGKFEKELEAPPGTGFEFEEEPYRSLLYDDIRAALRNLLKTGGTGLGAEVEQQLWDRAKARVETENARVYNEAENYFAARGHTLPPGAMAGRLTEALQEQTRSQNQISAEIAIEQARLAQNDTQHVRQSILQLEQVSQDIHMQIQQRAYEKVRDAAGIFQKMYDQKVAAFLAEMNSQQINAETERIKAEANASYNRTISEIYQADISAYQTQVQTELGLIEGAVQVFGAEISGYSATADAKAKQLDADIEMFRAQITQSNNQTSLSLQEAQMVLTQYIEGLRLDGDIEKSHSQILSQIVASLYNAISVSGRLSFGQSQSSSVRRSYNYNYSS